MTLESQRLKSEIGSRQDLLQRIDTETVLVEEVGAVVFTRRALKEFIYFPVF